jgi:hypothetical protein
LYEALPGGGSALARLAERAERQSPRTLAGWLRRPSFKGAPKPLKDKRQAAFMQLVRDDVLKVAKQGGLSLEQAAKLMCEAVGSQALEVALEVTLSQADKEYLLHSLDELLRELALARLSRSCKSDGTATPGAITGGGPSTAARSPQSRRS